MKRKGQVKFENSVVAFHFSGAVWASGRRVFYQSFKGHMVSVWTRREQQIQSAEVTPCCRQLKQQEQLKHNAGMRSRSQPVELTLEVYNYWDLFQLCTVKQWDM